MSDFQRFGRLREKSRAASRDENDVLVADSSDAWDVDSGFDGEHLPGQESGCGKARGLVDIEPEAVTCPVKESLPPAVADFGRVAMFGKIRFDRFVDYGPLVARLHFLKRHHLPREAGLP